MLHVHTYVHDVLVMFGVCLMSGTVHCMFPIYIYVHVCAFVNLSKSLTKNLSFAAKKSKAFKIRLNHGLAFKILLQTIGAIVDKDLSSV